MMVRAAYHEELDLVIELVNSVFRQSKGWEKTMKEEFPLLLSHENINHIRVISQNGKPISVASFLLRTVLVEGNPVKVASVGAVCTDENSRCKRCSSLILDDLERVAAKDGAEILLVSGTRSLYRRRNCSLVQPFSKYTFLPKIISSNFIMREYIYSDLQEVMRLYNSQSTRFVRSAEDFSALINSAVIPWGNQDYKRYVLVKDEILIGYLFININLKTGSVLEAYGSSDILEEAISTAAQLLNLEQITYSVHKNDALHYFKNHLKKEQEYQEGTVKILNFNSLISSLCPYFSQYLSFEESETLAKKLANMLPEIGLDSMNRLILGGEFPKEDALLSKVFPLPFPHLANLNYQ